MDGPLAVSNSFILIICCYQGYTCSKYAVFIYMVLVVIYSAELFIPELYIAILRKLVTHWLHVQNNCRRHIYNVLNRAKFGTLFNLFGHEDIFKIYPIDASR